LKFLNDEYNSFNKKRARKETFEAKKEKGLEGQPRQDKLQLDIAEGE